MSAIVTCDECGKSLNGQDSNTTATLTATFYSAETGAQLWRKASHFHIGCTYGGIGAPYLTAETSTEWLRLVIRWQEGIHFD